MITRIWHGATTAIKSNEYLNLMRTVAIPHYRSTPGNKGASVAKYYDFDKDFLLELEPCSTHYEMYDG